MHSLAGMITSVLVFASSHLEAQNSAQVVNLLSDRTAFAGLGAIDGADDLIWGELKVGVDCYGQSGRYQWNGVPEALSGVQFLVSPFQSGVLNFKTLSSGLVLMATTTRWKGGGNSGGDWKESAMDERDLRRKGWCKLRAMDDLSNTDTGTWVVFFRMCEAGEAHSIRTEKYVAPVLLIP